MPSPFSITKEDLLRSKVVTPGWYLLQIKNIKQGPGKNDPDSTTTEVSFEILDGANKEFVGVPIRHWFSEKMADAAVPFIQAMTGKKIEDSVNFDMDACLGHNVRGYVINEKFNNRVTNRLADFMPAQG